MPKFHVEVPEVWYQTMEVDAKNEDEARDKVANAGGVALDGHLDYSHTLDDLDLFKVWEANE